MKNDVNVRGTMYASSTGPWGVGVASCCVPSFLLALSLKRAEPLPLRSKFQVNGKVLSHCVQDRSKGRARQGARDRTIATVDISECGWVFVSGLVDGLCPPFSILLLALVAVCLAC